MKSSGWLLIIAMGAVFFFLGYRNLQIGDFRIFILVFVATVAVSLFIFWSYGRGKNGN
ncbi:MAG: hypothetical protein H6Q43_3118 [Deltaproteobacteria bacterium]|jgi:uncharacterized membrane protein YadS|nr:hypothetical protein [Deltaproteobacteria bacterium]